jgi:hypothetical protein
MPPRSAVTVAFDNGIAMLLTLETFGGGRTYRFLRFTA